MPSAGGGELPRLDRSVRRAIEPGRDRERLARRLRSTSALATAIVCAPLVTSMHGPIAAAGRRPRRRAVPRIAAAVRRLPRVAHHVTKVARHPATPQAMSFSSAARSRPLRLATRSVRRGLVGTFRSIMRLYFREIERIGTPPPPDTRGRVFVSNHHNALIDPILVLTDTECEISPIAKSTLWNVPGLEWLLDRAGAVPIVRKKDAPRQERRPTTKRRSTRSRRHLAGGGNILIFPEGTSHSEPQLAPLRTGAARMLVAAETRGAAHAADVPGRRARVRRARRLSLALPRAVGPVREPRRRRGHRRGRGSRRSPRRWTPTCASSSSRARRTRSAA